MDNNKNVVRCSRVGSANPMYGRTQSQQTRDSISKSQRARYELENPERTDPSSHVSLTPLAIF